MLLDGYNYQVAKSPSKNPYVCKGTKGNQMNYHKGHKVLGHYCWDCQLKTVAGVPGWPKRSHDDGPKDTDVTTTSVMWADGSEDVQRDCDICKTLTCKYPVHEDKYEEVGAPDGI